MLQNNLFHRLVARARALSKGLKTQAIFIPPKGVLYVGSHLSDASRFEEREIQPGSYLALPGLCG